jgi:hypothetical protein
MSEATASASSLAGALGDVAQKSSEVANNTA